MVGQCTSQTRGHGSPPTCGLLHSTPSGELVERTPHRFWWCPYRTREIQSRTISIFLCIRQHHAWARTAEHHGSQDASPTVKPPPAWPHATARRHAARPRPPWGLSGLQISPISRRSAAPDSSRTPDAIATRATPAGSRDRGTGRSDGSGELAAMAARSDQRESCELQEGDDTAVR